MALRIYIAGPISGVPELAHNYRERFAAAAIEVATMGHVPVSPIEVCQLAGMAEGEHQWSEYMKADIRALLECDGIYCLDQWWNSRGARCEQMIATALGLVVLYQVKEK